MEPVTHVLTGACLARTGLNRRAAYATLAMAIAAEFPDIDTLWSLRGPVSGFEHHRGLTHSFVGLPFEAAFLLLIFILLHRFRTRRAQHAAAVHGSQRPLTAAPVRWGVLYALLLLALCSHLLLDYTNNYGLRPFLPFQGHWYAASLVFIFDPLIFLLLVAGLLFPALFWLVSQEVGSRKRSFPGAGWARAALIGVALLWGVRAYEHGLAVTVAQAQTLAAPIVEAATPAATSPDDGSEAAAAATDAPRPLLTARSALANPDPFSPFHWYTVTDFGPAYRLGTVDSRSETFFGADVLPKPAPSPELLAAQQSRLGRIYLNWSAAPFFGVYPADQADAQLPSGSRQIVTLQDLRFAGATPLLHREGRIPLTGRVVLDSAGQVIAEGMDNRLGR